MTLEIKIRMVRNGFVLAIDEKDDLGNPITIETVIAFDDDKLDFAGENCERAALAEALENIVDYFGMYYQKHHLPDDKFIKIKMVLGDHYWDDEKDEECEYKYPVLNKRGPMV
jgi:hypothetical protein